MLCNLKHGVHVVTFNLNGFIQTKLWYYDFMLGYSSLSVKSSTNGFLKGELTKNWKYYENKKLYPLVTLMREKIWKFEFENSQKYYCFLIFSIKII